ncbi:MAG: heavy metal translocating P-type ATPase [Clostridia bacterium]|nr:heavy metal translocating P-type ATPase [Clostridia bacterium]
MTNTYSITGMTCSACSLGIEKAVGKLAGVRRVSVSLMGKSMKIEYDEGEVTEDKIFETVKSLGYGIYQGATLPKGVDRRERTLLFRFIVSVVLLFPLMYVCMGHMIADSLGNSFRLGYLDPMEYPQWYCLYLFILSLAVVIVNREYFVRGFFALIHKSPNMDTLVSLGSGISFIYSIVMTILCFVGVYGSKHPGWAEYSMNVYYEAAAMILALVDIGKWLEEKSRARTGKELESLSKLAPDRVTIEEDGVQFEVKTADVAIGDIVIVRQGEYIPVDGVVIEGSSFVDKSAITGESLPVEVSEGDSVCSASLNQSANIKVRADKVGEDTTLSKIIGMVREAGASKAPIQKLADRIAGIFVPLVFALAVVTFLVWFLIDGGYVQEHCMTYAINVLVISCPCALGLATPVAIMTSAGKAASMGILYKDAESMQKIGGVNCVLLDKTATITNGKPEITDVMTYDCKEEDVLFIACGIEKNSNHPLAKCIVDHVGEGAAVTGYEYTVARGAKAEYGGKTYKIGNEIFAGAANGNVKKDAERLSKEGKSILYFSENGKVIALIAVADTVKEGSKKAIELLRARGMRVAMLTGDDRMAAEAIAREVGIDEVAANILPEDKLEAVKNVRAVGGVVAMVGDGINDSPALKESDVGIAMGAGTDVAIDSAGVVLLSEDLRTLDTVFDLSKATMRNIRENLFWAFFYNIIMIPVAAGVFSRWFSFSPIICAACMCLSSIFVVCNALRLLLYKNRRVMREKPAPVAGGEMSEEGSFIVVKIKGMMCEHCVKRVTDALSAVSGVSRVEVYLEGGIARVFGEDVDTQDVRTAVENVGYKFRGIKNA